MLEATGRGRTMTLVGKWKVGGPTAFPDQNLLLDSMYDSRFTDSLW